MTPSEIKRTKLYRTLAPCIVKKDREELARMLAMVPEIAKRGPGGNGFASARIMWAFWWDETPQGSHYWRELSDRLGDAGHACW